MEHEKFRLGVPFAGRYKEILNSNARTFGGTGRVNGRVKTTKRMEWDEREYSIEIYIPPMSVSIYTCIPEAGIPKAQRKGAQPRPELSKQAGPRRAATQPAVKKGGGRKGSPGES